MECDPIVKEVRMIRRKLFRQYHNNLDELIAFVEKDMRRGRNKAAPPTIRRHRRTAIKG